MTLRDVVDRIRRIVAIGHVSVVQDDGAQQVGQVHISAGGLDGVEEIIDGVPRIGQYGLAYCPPDGSEVVTVFLGGRRSNGVIIATGHRDSRPKGLKPGEAMLYNGLTDAYVMMSADGKIRSQGDWLHTGSFSATGDVLDHSGDGHGQTMKAMRQVYNGHTHPSGTPNTAAPNQQQAS